MYIPLVIVGAGSIAYIYTLLRSNTIGTMLSYTVALLNASPNPRVRFDLRIINTGGDLKTLTRVSLRVSLSDNV